MCGCEAKYCILHSHYRKRASPPTLCTDTERILTYKLAVSVNQLVRVAIYLD